MGLAPSGRHRRLLGPITNRLGVLGMRYHLSPGGEITFRCLNHDDRHASFSFNLYKGLGHCFSCGWSPRTKTLGRRLGIDLGAEEGGEAEESPRKPRKGWRVPPLGDRGRAYLRERGIAGTIVEKARIGEVAQGLVIPWVGRGGEVIFPAVRAWEGTPKYVIPPGVDKGAQLYGWHLGIGRQAVLVEGELDAVNLHQYGYPALAMGTSHITAAQVADLREVREVFILLDGDSAGERGAVSVYAALCASRPTRILQVPLGRDPGDLSEAESVDILRNVDRRQ